MTSGVSLDRRQWTSAVTQYAAASGKTFDQSLDRFLVKLAHQCRKTAPVANRASIRPLVNEHKFVAWLARRTYGSQPRVARMYKRDRQSVSAKGRKSRRKSKEATRGRMVSYTAEEARELAKRHVSRRASSVGFIRNFFRMWLAGMGGKADPGRGAWRGGRVNGSRAAGAARHRTNAKGAGFDVRYHGQKSVMAHTGASGVSVSYEFKSGLVQQPSVRARSAEKVMQRILDSAVLWAVRDTVAYVNNKQAKLARKYSA